MIYLALSIACSSIQFVVFKFFGIYRVNNLYAIIANYLVAGSLGAFFLLWSFEDSIPFEVLMPVLGLTATLGLLFILVFRLVALTSQQNGVRVASVAMKMSLVIPALLGVIWLGEDMGLLGYFGIMLAIAAIILSNYNRKNEFRWSHLRLPFLVFLGSGTVDAGINLIRAFFLEDRLFPFFTTVVFFSAGISGIAFLAVNRTLSRIRPMKKDLYGGIALGIPNYFSLFFLLKSLDVQSLNSAIIFTVNNVAIVLLTTMLGLIMFKERLNGLNYLGIGLAVLSILAITG